MGFQWLMLMVRTRDWGASIKVIHTVQLNDSKDVAMVPVAQTANGSIQRVCINWQIV